MPDLTNNEQALALLFEAAQYAVNRLDSSGYSQIAGDLAVALAQARDLATIPDNLKNKFYIPPCDCKFVGPGQPMDTSKCKLHPKAAYPCERTRCPDYRPRSEPQKLEDGGIFWPRCVCGEIAQEHN